MFVIRASSILFVVAEDGKGARQYPGLEELATGLMEQRQKVGVISFASHASWLLCAPFGFRACDLLLATAP